jgi:hypothetical protein
MGSALAARPADELLPGTTKGFLSVPDPQELKANWERTQLGQLMQDPQMQPFVQDLRRQVRDRLTRMYSRLSLTLEDLRGVAGGEVAVAVVRPDEENAERVVLVDVTGHEAQLAALLSRIDESLTERKASRTRPEFEGVTLTVYVLPPRDGTSKPREVVFFVHEDMLCGTDSLTLAQQILGRFSHDGGHDDTLRNQQAYRAVMDRCAEHAGELAPNVRWYVDPFGFIEALRSVAAPAKRKKGKDLVKILADQGFKAVQAIGGYANFHVDGRYEVLHRTVVYAPPNQEGAPGGEKYRLAARVLDFPNGGRLEPQKWIPREIAMYGSFNWEVQRAFDASETLVDAIIGEEGAFQEILKGIREDPVGPQIDLRGELVAHLGTRATLISDNVLPITPQSERWLFALETSSEDQLASTIDRTMQTDPNARRHELDGNVVWEIVEEDADLPELTIESPSFNPLLGGGGEEPKEEIEDHSLPSSAVCVAKGHLLIASHFEFLQKVLRAGGDERETLAPGADYQLVATDSDKLGPKEYSFRFFSRTDEAYRPAYELIRAGKMPEAESMLGRVLNRLFGEEDEDLLREQRIDGRQMPDFEMVRRYLGPGGLTVRSDADGWFAVGFMVSKEAAP